MWFKHPAWIPFAWVLSIANVGAVWFAAAPAEPWHATAHALAAVLFGLGALRLQVRKERTAVAGAVRRSELEAGMAAADPQQVAQALEAIAIEVERLGEGQRFLTKLLTERDARPAEQIRSQSES